MCPAHGLILAGAAFGTLALLARAPGPLLRIDVPVARALQGVDLPLYGWVLTHVSDLGYSPLSVVAYAAVGGALLTVTVKEPASG